MREKKKKMGLGVGMGGVWIMRCVNIGTKEGGKDANDVPRRTYITYYSIYYTFSKCIPRMQGDE
jgi:hypothetical protein